MQLSEEENVREYAILFTVYQPTGLYQLRMCLEQNSKAELRVITLYNCHMLTSRGVTVSLTRYYNEPIHARRERFFVAISNLTAIL